MNLSTQSLAFQQHQPSFLASYIPDFTNVEESFHKLVQMTASWPSRRQPSERDRFPSTSLGALFSTSPASTSPSASSPTSSTSSVRMSAATVSPTSISNNNNCEKTNKNRLKSDYGADTDCETHPPSDTEQNEAEPEVNLLLLKMEELNKLNEQDSRSVTSRKSCSSSSNLGGDSPSRHNSCHPDDDENLDLWTIWGDLVKSWEIELRKRPNYVKELVKRGVPQHFRTITWQLLSCANAASIHDIYSEYMRTPSPYEKVIMRDIPRTYPELEFFKDHGRGQAALFNVIKAYSIHDKEVGYCQGSAFIVGQLLLQMPEEEAFAVFVRLMEHYRLRELYKPAMTELGLCMFQLECLVQEQMPDLYTHFNNMGFDTSMYASSWFLTLFTTTLPLDLANRIMDIFLLDGIESIFRVAMAILQQARIDLLKLDMEGMLKYFQREIREKYENDHDLLFAVAFQVTLNAKKMKKLEKDYLAKRTKEQEEAVELRRTPAYSLSSASLHCCLFTLPDAASNSPKINCALIGMNFATNWPSINLLSSEKPIESSPTGSRQSHCLSSNSILKMSSNTRSSSTISSDKDALKRFFSKAQFRLSPPPPPPVDAQSVPFREALGF
ncbi:hypothetical protein QR680_016201 [Steinernema hermaphroditum]|uniref:Rab-GAP TBC domain-containing protein n=1 Tax=Steinernema hermaphroditum TaxID=289476 RepID=A0AA39HAE5_9BILA|nr:hypothetical protein QR680_016201 [Steinernema hermaphroditum]